MNSNLSHSIERSFWGRIGEKPVWLYKLTIQNGLKMSVTNYGAIVQSLEVPDSDRELDVVLGYDTLNEYITDPFYMGAVVGRCTNRIATGKVKIHDKIVQLSLTPSGFHQHGGHEGFNKKIWEAETFVKEETVGIILNYKSPDGEEGYPGNLDVTVTYTLHEDRKWSVEFLATTDRPTIINPTQHSYFNLQGHAKGNIANHVMKSNAPFFLPATEKSIPTGEIASVTNTPFDFLQSKKMGENMDSRNPQLSNSLGYDHFLVLEKTNNVLLKKAVTITEPTSDRRMEVFTTEPGFHFYSGNFLASHLAGKDKAIYHPCSGFCLETHHFPDSPNHQHFPSIVLEPGIEFKSRTEFVFQ